VYIGTHIGDLEETQDPEHRQHESDTSRTEEAVNNQILALLPDPAPRGFFGPKRLRPSTAAMTKAPRRMNTKRPSSIADHLLLLDHLLWKKIHFQSLILTHM
jgi:hypothetical protein